MQILTECKLVMSYAGLGPAEKAKSNISRFVPRIILSSTLMLHIWIQWHHLIQYKAHGVQAILFPIHCILIFVMKLATYIVFIAKAGKIAELIEYLELVVNERKCFRTKMCDSVLQILNGLISVSIFFFN